MVPAAFLSTCTHLVCSPSYTLGGGAATKESNLGLQICGLVLYHLAIAANLVANLVALDLGFDQQDLLSRTC